MEETDPSKDLDAALKRIKQLEAQVAELQATKSTAENDVISVLRNLQEQWQATFKDSMISVDVDRLVPPKKRQIFVCSLIFLLPPACVILTVVLLFCAFSNMWLAAALIVYFTWIKFDQAPIRGSRPLQWFKKSWIWRQFSDYFPILLRKANPDTPFPVDQTYLFGYHPHGIISVGGFVNFGSDATGFSKLFPGIQVHGATLQSNFSVPFFREVLLAIGAISVAAPSIKHVLRRGPGHGVLVVPGGAAEALDARPGVHDLTLQKRSGFFRIALQHGVHLVPIYSFGENNLYEQIENGQGSFVRQMQEAMLRLLGVATPYCFGSGSLCFPMLPGNPIPKRHPIITIVGDPIPCKCIENPTDNDIEELRGLYIDKLKDIFDQFADQYAIDRKGPLRIVK